MEAVYIVICEDVSMVMGVFTTLDKAIACKEYYQDRFPNEKYSISTEIVDDLDY